MGFPWHIFYYDDDLPHQRARFDEETNNLPALIFSPYKMWYRLLQNILTLMVIYPASVYPFHYVFMQKNCLPLAIFDFAFNVSILIDILLKISCVAYFDMETNRIVTNRTRIFKRYIRNNWFALMCDVLGTLHYKWGHRSITGFLLSMFRLWRLVPLHSYFKRLENDDMVNFFRIRLLKVISMTLYVIHCGACISYVIADRHSDPTKTWIGSIKPNFKELNIWVRYLISLYWATVTYCTLGFGDYTAKTNGEMIFIICYLLFTGGVSLYTAVIFGDLILKDSKAKMKLAVARAEEKVMIAEANAEARIKEAVQREEEAVKEKQELLVYVNQLKAQLQMV